MIKYRLTISYDGTPHGGWQRQSNFQKPCIQQVIEDALSSLFGTKITVLASGRTDAGVHAIEQTIHFRSLKLLETADFCYSLNSLLPDSIICRRAFIAPPHFHAMASAVSKIYRYRVYNALRPSPLFRNVAQWVRTSLDLSELNALAAQIEGTHDFTSFKNSGTKTKHNVRTVFSAKWTCQPAWNHIESFPEKPLTACADEKTKARSLNAVSGESAALIPLRQGEPAAMAAYEEPSFARSSLVEKIPLEDRFYDFTIVGDGFLKQMVRNLVGTQIQLAVHKRPSNEIGRILAAKDRKAALKTAPAWGLYLVRVNYPEDLDKECREI